ncbi:ABC transporter ATP-binding protein [Pseudorhodoplanes sp.]|uniref:ABC transporter ATP-binding protein n=1 Tax=Pseudorhodoplanes sp. TaxID=1934341 RepID=UPI00391B6000
MTAPLLSIHNVCKRLGGLIVSEDISIDIMPGELQAVIGPNGAGKTTLLNQIGGQLIPDSGTIVFAGLDVTSLPVQARARLGIGRTFQVPKIFPSFAAVDNPAIGALGSRPHAFGFWTPLRNLDDIGPKAVAALDAVGLTDKHLARTELLSHGDRRLVEIATALAGKPRLLLLDEPMAGLGRDESLRMAMLLKALKGGASIVMVEHDMDAVFALADTVTVLAHGRVIASDRPEQIRSNPKVRSSYLGDNDDV